MSGLPEGTPILCRRCGGAMTLLADMSVQCRHCGALDRLPGDELGRMLEIKNRLALAEQRSLQVRGVDATLATIFEDRMAFVRVGGLYVAVALIIVVAASSQLISIPVEKIPTETLVELIAAQLTGPAIMIGIAFSFMLALGYGRFHYQRSLRPLLVAQLPPEPGARARCRVCGGDLPEARGVDVRCIYCRSVNLIPKALHGAQAQALAREADALRAKLTGVNVATMSIGRRMQWAMLIFTALSILFGLSLPAVGKLLASYVEF
ncbi:MAG TPA: hypothetical protein VGK73_37530 [Polyangiaceae bacterium]